MFYVLRVFFLFISYVLFGSPSQERERYSILGKKVVFSLRRHIQIRAGRHPASEPLQCYDCFPDARRTEIEMLTKLYLMSLLRKLEPYLRFLINPYHTFC